MVRESQKRAKARWDERNRNRYKPFTMRFKEADLELYEHLHSQEDMAAYIKGLIRKDIDNS